jgi:hypothetical protein
MRFFAPQNLLGFYVCLLYLPRRVTDQQVLCVETSSTRGWKESKDITIAPQVCCCAKVHEEYPAGVLHK